MYMSKQNIIKKTDCQSNRQIRITGALPDVSAFILSYRKHFENT